jgi:uncharacterized protein YbjQ (UPF0145 family)
MSNTRVVWAIVAAGVLAGGVLTGCSKSESPSSSESPGTTATTAVVEDISVAVGTGEFTDVEGDNDPSTNTIVGFTATAPTNDEAAARVIKACEDAGGVECTADEVTNDNVCIASVASSETLVVAGGAGATVEDARLDAIKKAEDNKTPLGADAVVVVSACP